jgi:hypothetical protein
MGKYGEAEHYAEKCLESAQVFNNQQDIGLAYNYQAISQSRAFKLTCSKIN